MGRRIVGLAMLGVQAAQLWRTMGYLPVAMLAIAIALLGCWPRLHVDWGKRKRHIAIAITGAAYFGWWWLDLQHMESRSAEFGNNMALAAALGLMMVQALHYFWRHSHGLPGHYPFLGGLALAFACDRYQADMSELAITFSLAMTFGLLMGLFYAVGGREKDPTTASHRAYRYVLLGLCLLLSFALASGTAWVIGRGERIAGQWLANRSFLQGQLVLGNRPSARLSSMTDIKGANFDQIALQIEAESSPGYLRGQVYSQYEHNAWNVTAKWASPPPLASGPDGYVPQWRGEQLYPVRPGATQLDATMIVYPELAIDRALFMPLSTGWVGHTRGAVQVSGTHVAQSAQALQGNPYQILTASAVPTAPLDDTTRKALLELPPELAPRLRSLAATICGDQSTVAGKANAITQYFTGHYDYALGIQVPAGTDPMTYFLFSEPLPDAHCEFFATGAALLLRAAGVPARYVTGVGVWEQHPFANYWVARNRDAHAWVEAWDPESGWFIVEATPAGGLPEAQTGHGNQRIRDFWSMVKLQVRQMVAALQNGAWTAALGATRDILLGLLAFLRASWRILLAIAAVGLLLWGARRRHRRRAVPREVHAQQQYMDAQLSRMDRWIWKRYRQGRGPHVTLHAFARSLETSLPESERGGAIAHWYRQWAETRYQASLDEEDIARLNVDLDRVCSKKSIREHSGDTEKGRWDEPERRR